MTIESSGAVGIGEGNGSPFAVGVGVLVEVVGCCVGLVLGD